MDQKSGTVYVNKSDREILIEVPASKTGQIRYQGKGKQAGLYKGYLDFRSENGEYVVSEIDANPKRQGLGALLLSALIENQTLIEGQPLPLTRVSTAAVSERRFYYGLGFRLDQPMLLYQAVGCPELIPDINRLVTFRPLVDALYLGFEVESQEIKKDVQASRWGFQPFLELVPDVETQEAFWKHDMWQARDLKGSIEIPKQVHETLEKTLALLDQAAVIQLFHLQGQTAFARLKEVVELASFSNRVTQLIARTNDISRSAEAVLSRNWEKQK